MNKVPIHLFVLSNDSNTLANVPETYPFEKVNLSELNLGRFQTNMLGETRAFLRDFKTLDAEYVGFINARWDQKYFKLRTRLSTLVPTIERFAAPGWVLCPWPAENWVDITLLHHPTMRPLLEELFAIHRIQPHNEQMSVWANDFVCHRSVFLDWHQFFMGAFEHFFAKYGPELPFELEGPNAVRKSAYFYERVTAAYFANRPDIRIAPFE